MPMNALLAAVAPLDTWSATFIAGLALFLPLAAFILILTFTIEYKRGSAWLSILFTAAALACALLVLAIELKHPKHLEQNATFLLFFTGESGGSAQFKLEWGVAADPLASMMLVVVGAVSLLIQVYSLGFMRGDDGFVRFFGVVALSTFALTGLVLSTNFFELFLFWELVGLCSYLLIGHWWRRPEAAAAAKKAFLVMRLGDIGLLVGIMYIYFRFHEFNFEALAPQYTAGKVGAMGLTIMALLVFAGALGKSAQFPLHAWLPDAMEAPLPGSAFLYGATMVGAGVYLVARAYALFHASPRALLVIAFIGAATALLATLWALAEDDIRRVVAYSTINHLGLMMLALGVGAYSAALFHLFTHAWFKALLFLAAANLVYALRTHRIGEMGGLWQRMPVTAWAMLIGAGAAAGIPPLSGFWSQTTIVSQVLGQRNPTLIAVMLAAIFFSALFIFRMFFVVFGGELARRRRFDPAKVREPGQSLTAPVVLLAILSVGAGIAWIPGLSQNFGTFVRFQGASTQPLNTTSVAVSTGLALAGLAAAWLFYGRRVLSAATLASRLPWAYHALRRGFYVDLAYHRGVAAGVLFAGRAAQWVDRQLIDVFLDGVAESWLSLGGLVRRLQTGRLQQYALGFFAGILVIAALSAGLGAQLVRRLTGLP